MPRAPQMLAYRMFMVITVKLLSYDLPKNSMAVKRLFLTCTETSSLLMNGRKLPAGYLATFSGVHQTHLPS